MKKKFFFKKFFWSLAEKGAKKPFFGFLFCMLIVTLVSFILFYFFCWKFQIKEEGFYNKSLIQFKEKSFNDLLEIQKKRKEAFQKILEKKFQNPFSQ